MYARATSGDKPNNSKFSSCSKRAMALVMASKAINEDGCFTGDAMHTNTIQYNTIQYNTILYNTIQYNAMQYNTIQLYCTPIQYNTMQYNTIIQCNVIQYNAMQYNAIQYNTIQYNFLGQIRTQKKFARLFFSKKFDLISGPPSTSGLQRQRSTTTSMATHHRHQAVAVRSRTVLWKYIWPPFHDKQCIVT